MKLPLLSINERKTTFKEVELGFTYENALAEAKRCLLCEDAPCVKACPGSVDIPHFIKAFRDGNITEAAEIIRQKDHFPSITGRICQQEKLCEGHCVIEEKDGGQINIGGIERYIGDNAPMPKRDYKNGKKVAVIGSGPTGLTAAAVLTLAGVNVTILEGNNTFGGVIKYGVPEFRLPKEIVSKELSGLHDIGVDFEPNAKVDPDHLEEIAKQYDAILIGTGVGKARKLNCKGSDLNGVMPAIKFLVNLNQSGLPLVSPHAQVFVIGAGYVGLDAARSAVRLGAEVYCLTHATEIDSCTRVAKEDYTAAREEGVKFLFESKISHFEGTDKVEKIVYDYKGTHVVDDADKIIVAIGQEHDTKELKEFLHLDERGNIIVNKKKQTKMLNVFAAGDAVHGPRTVIEAIATGRDAAHAILAYFSKQQDKKDEAGQKAMVEKEMAKHKSREKADNIRLLNKDI